VNIQHDMYKLGRDWGEEIEKGGGLKGFVEVREGGKVRQKRTDKINVQT